MNISNFYSHTVSSRRRVFGALLNFDFNYMLFLIVYERYLFPLLHYFLGFPVRRNNSFSQIALGLNLLQIVLFPHLFRKIVNFVN